MIIACMINTMIIIMIDLNSDVANVHYLNVYFDIKCVRSIC